MENLQKVISNLKTQLAELEKVAAGEVDIENARIWPVSVDDLPKKEKVWWIIGKEVFCGTADNDFREHPTEAAALSAAAFSQLSRMIHHINGGDVYMADCTTNWYRVGLNKIGLSVTANSQLTLNQSALHFKNEYDAIRSIETHRALWLQYFTGKKQENNEQ